MKEESLKQLKEIRNLMERSSRFISLSGLSGVFAGIVALTGAIFAFFYLDYDLRYFDPGQYFNFYHKYISSGTIITLGADAAIVFILAVSFAIIFTTRKAKKEGQKIWNPSTKLLLINLAIPLATGGIFCILLLYHRLVFLLAPTTLVFYGLALINAAKYTLTEIHWLGISEVILGLVATAFAGYGLIAWAFGFGILHIIYGAVMYYKYDIRRKQ